MTTSHSRLRILLTLALVLPGLAGLPAQGQSSGPDVQVSDFPDVSNHGSVGNLAAFSFGTMACNVGNQDVSWIGWNNQHPVITQNLYRLMNDRIVQIGMSWVVHGFAPLNGSNCSGCSGGSATTLGSGCSDTMSAALNGQQINLGPRSEIDPLTGAFPFQPIMPGALMQSIDRRLQVDHAFLDPAQNSGAQYFVESICVAADDAANGNYLNNASHREVTVTANSGSYDLATTGVTQKNLSAINAWKAVDPSVIIEHVDVPGDGRFTVGFKAVSGPTGFTRYEYAIHNLNVERAAVAVSVDVPAGAAIQNIGFQDISYHSGEVLSDVDWTPNATATGVRWSTTDFATDPNANALRWGTLYNFWFESATQPGIVTIELFKPGTPATVSATSMAQCPPAPTPKTLHGYSLTPNPAYDEVFIVPQSISPTNLAGGMSATIPIGFDFPFYDQTLTEIQIGPEGYLAVAGTQGDVATNQLLPDLQQPNGVIAPYWDDLDPALGGVVRYANLGTSPNQRLVVEYFNIPNAATPTDTESFQISLYETTGRITYSYITSSQGGAGATIGIERPDAGTGMTLSYNIAGLAVPGTSIEFIRAPTGATTADLIVTGDGTAGTLLAMQILSVPQRPLLLMGDLNRGPTYIGSAWPPLDIGFSPAFMMFFDGPGVFGPPDAAAVTDGCGIFALSFTSPLPSGFEYTVQGIVVEQFAPTPILHVTNSHRIVVP